MFAEFAKYLSRNEFANLVDVDELSARTDLPIELIRELKDHLNWDILPLVYFTREFMHEFEEYILFDTLIDYEVFEEWMLVEFTRRFNWGFAGYDDLVISEATLRKCWKDWDHVSQWSRTFQMPLSEKYLRDAIANGLADRDDFEAIAQHQKLSLAFINEFIEELDTPSLIKHQRLDEATLRRLVSESTMELILRFEKNLSESFLEDYAHWINFSDPDIYEKHTFSDGFLRSHIDQLDFSNETLFFQVSEQFVQDFYHRFDVVDVISYMNLSDEFLYQHAADFVEVEDVLIKYQKLSTQFMKDHPHLLMRDACILGFHQAERMDQELIETHYDHIVASKRSWGSLQLRVELSVEFMVQHHSDMSSYAISRFQKHAIESVDALDEVGLIDWEVLSTDRDLSYEFIMRHRASIVMCDRVADTIHTEHSRKALELALPRELTLRIGEFIG